MTNENNVSKKTFSLTDKIIIVALLGWILFGGGYSLIKSAATTKNLRQVTTTIGTGVQRLADKGSSANLQPTTGSSTTIKPGTKLPPAPARTAGGAGASTGSVQPTAAVVATVQPTAAVVASAGAAPAEEVAAAPAFMVPLGAHTAINPDGSFTVDNGNMRYYPNSEGVIVEVRIVDTNYEPAVDDTGLPPEQKIFLDPNDPEDAEALAKVPTPATTVQGSPCRRGCPKR